MVARGLDLALELPHRFGLTDASVEVGVKLRAISATRVSGVTVRLVEQRHRSGRPAHGKDPGPALSALLRSGEGG